MSYLSQHLAWYNLSIYLIIYVSVFFIVLFCFEFCQLYLIFCDAEIKMADLMTLKYLSCSLHGQPER